MRDTLNIEDTKRNKMLQLVPKFANIFLDWLAYYYFNDIVTFADSSIDHIFCWLWIFLECHLWPWPLTFAAINVYSWTTSNCLSTGQIWERSDEKWQRNRRTQMVGKKYKTKKKEEKTTQQQKGLPTLSADLNYYVKRVLNNKWVMFTQACHINLSVWSWLENLNSGTCKLTMKLYVCFYCSAAVCSGCENLN